MLPISLREAHAFALLAISNCSVLLSYFHPACGIQSENPL